MGHTLSIGRHPVVRRRPPPAGGIPSHVAPEVPGSIHEGGELGYSLMHAYGAAFDNPDLLVACVIGDGEAETGPLARSNHRMALGTGVGDEPVRAVS
jgi:xylulose-5-phosphate/fructose-6-phosphate phosphoketolase